MTPVVDIAGTEYKVGDYVFCAVHAGCSSVNTYIGKVVATKEKSISVKRHYGSSQRKNPYVRSALMVPNRHLIIPEELALSIEPNLKDM